MSALHGINMDVLIEVMEKEMPTPKRDLTKNPLMFVARSFDINKPGTEPQKLTGGVIGGALKEGKLLCTVDQHADKLAVSGIEYALDMLGKGATPQDKETAVDLIIAETLK